MDAILKTPFNPPISPLSKGGIGRGGKLYTSDPLDMVSVHGIANLMSYGPIVKTLSLTSTPTFTPSASFKTTLTLHFVEETLGTVQL
jgi:hypothetical protein